MPSSCSRLSEAHPKPRWANTWQMLTGFRRKRRGHGNYGLRQWAGGRAEKPSDCGSRHSRCGNGATWGVSLRLGFKLASAACEEGPFNVA